MTGAVRLEGPVYSLELRYDPDSYSPRDTMRTYSFGWMYWGEDRGYIELCRGSVAEVSWSDAVLSVRVFSEPGTRCWEMAINNIAGMLGVNEDLAEYWRLARGDPLVGGLAESMRGLRLRQTSIWYGFLVAVCQQNVSFRQGWNMLYRLHLNASRRLVLPNGRVYLETPSPQNLSFEVLRSSGLGYRARTVLNLVSARAWELECGNLEEARSVLGVGNYTVSLVELLACRNYSSLLLDRWLRRLAAEAYKVSEREAAKALTERFGEWRGLAAIHTTIAFDAEPSRRALERLRRGENKPGRVEPSPISLWKHTPPVSS
ncbi:hypothetical protein [Hyperthermus butylicus]|uniref:Uncharacterized protein n=1 Tax=Hyperthermus butylicus (strain DSM 5456 / JCM 9403 / PLM1-5) TaxID=415426 RepID=A2BKD4_HYPBU|nr:hypothetical protein [Hyperthermus butylicus]ABM80445.1 hypothetical protein Hbut_0585 [Hyperthermus butylicus DSM 5456]